MRLDKHRVLTLFALFCDIDDFELLNWEGLCEASMIKIMLRLRKDVDISCNMERLCTAAAACAYFDYSMLRESDAENVRVGDISVSSSSKNDVRSIRDYFLGEISDLTDPPDVFAFASAESKL